MICKDKDECETWFGVDGSLICRHGVVSFPSNDTSLTWICPLEIQERYERKKWNLFFEKYKDFDLLGMIRKYEKLMRNERKIRHR